MMATTCVANPTSRSAAWTAASASAARIGVFLVVGTGIDPVTSRFSGARSTN